MGVVVDTSVLIAAERRKFALDAMFDSHRTDTFVIAAITVSEMLFGCHRLRDEALRARRLAAVETMLARLDVLDFGALEARMHAMLRADLQLRGTPIGPFDTLICATALAQGHRVATLNVAEFSRVPGLDLIDVTPFAAS